MNTKTQEVNNYEPGYDAVLVREETKKELQALRKQLTNKDLMQERRLATAAVELIVEEAVKDAEILDQLLQRAREIVLRDLKTEEQERAKKKAAGETSLNLQHCNTYS